MVFMVFTMVAWVTLLIFSGGGRTVVKLTGVGVVSPPRFLFAVASLYYRIPILLVLLTLWK